MLKQKIFGMILLLIMVGASAAIFSTGCYDETEARVTIHLERNDLAFNNNIKQKKIIDKILEFFSTPANAVIPPDWDNSHGPLILTITSSEFDALTFSIPATEITYSVTLPPTQNVRFEIISTTSSGLVTKNWGGHKTVSLSTGEQSVNITMLPMTKITNVIGTSDLNIYWVTDNMPILVTSFNIYRSNISSGVYTNIKTVNYSNGSMSQNTNDLPGSGTFFYKISVNSAYGEGVLCDPVSGTLL